MRNKFCTSFLHIQHNNTVSSHLLYVRRTSFAPYSSTVYRDKYLPINEENVFHTFGWKHSVIDKKCPCPHTKIKKTLQHFWGLKDGLYSTMTSPWLGIGSGFTQIAVVWIFEIFYRISRRHISPIQNGSSLFISCPSGFDSQKNKGRRKSGDSLLLKTVFKLCSLTPIRGTCTPLLVLLKTGSSNVYSMVRVRYYLFCEAVHLNDGYGKG